MDGQVKYDLYRVELGSNAWHYVASRGTIKSCRMAARLNGLGHYAVLSPTNEVMAEFAVKESTSLAESFVIAE